jgi:RNA polymerase sigma-70 factor (ECF subfamily)
VRGEVEQVYRAEGGRVLATLIRLLGDFELAEDALQDAFAAALEQWPSQGRPANPRAWLVGVARHKGIDRIRRAATLRDLEPALVVELEGRAADNIADVDSAVPDDLLRLVFTCCHPALNLDAQVALTLHAVCGLPTEAVARAFLTSTETMAQRLVRAKQKIRVARIPYQTPGPAELDARLEGVLAVAYLVYTEGYAGTSGEQLLSVELCEQAIRLARALSELLPGRSAIQGLLALMLLHHARHRARVSSSGDVILLDEQDRKLWDEAAIAEGAGLVESALQIPGPVSPYAVQAAIAALHARAPTTADTDWRQIVGLYEVLLRLRPTPVVELNHAVAVAMVDGPARALDLLDALAARGSLSGYHLLPAARAELLARMGRQEDAASAYREALVLARLEPERRLLRARLAALGSRSDIDRPVLSSDILPA